MVQNYNYIKPELLYLRHSPNKNKSLIRESIEKSHPTITGFSGAGVKFSNQYLAACGIE
jgi:hypothetical protein